MRPGCDRPAAARLTWDPVGRALWLDDVEDDQQAQQVCWEHAETLSAPRGWTVTDRRSSDVALGPPGAAGPGDESPPGSTRAAVQSAVQSAGQSAQSAESAPSGPGPGRPAGSDEAHRGAVRADRPRPRLLERALDWTGDQRSAITERGPRPD
jgi:hypothetical protein